MKSPLKISISTCPNDTYTFAGLLSGAVQVAGCQCEFELLDIQALNQQLKSGQADVLKASFSAAAQAPNYWALPVGAALGFGVGPVVLSQYADAAQRLQASATHGQAPHDKKHRRLLGPGADTTATLLFEHFHSDWLKNWSLEHCVFSEIIPALEQDQALLGVCIHEGRFTFAEHGLHLIEDLGERWEQEFQSPLPLGGLLAKRSLPSQALDALVNAVRESLDFARAEPEVALQWMRRYAQEFSDDVLGQHVELYVNQHTRELGAVGHSALAALRHVAKAQPGGLNIWPRHQRTFHLAPKDAWNAHWSKADAGAWSPASLQTEGFVHLSHANQLLGTLNLHFPGSDPLLLIELDPLQLDAELVLEASRENLDFPHLYRGIEQRDLLGQWTLEREPQQGWVLPDELEA